MKAIHRLSLVICTLCLSAVVGCGGGDNYAITGTAKIKGNGPLTKGVIHFDSGKGHYAGQIQSNGSYSVQGDVTGAPPGNYKVYFSGTDEGDYTSLKPVIHKRYMDMASTDLTAEVKPQSNKLDFELDPPQ